MTKKNAISSRQLLFGGIAVLALLGFIALLVAELISSYEKDVAFSRKNAENMTRILDRHVLASIEKIDVVLLTAVQELEPAITGRGKHRWASADINTRLGQLLANIPESQSLRVVDAQGRFIFDATGQLFSTSVADRRYFQAHRDRADAGLVISEPIFARLTSNWVVTVSRRLNHPDGSFAGLVQAAVRADYFANFYQTLNIGGGMVALYDSDLRLVARYPSVPGKQGQRLEQSRLEQLLASGLSEGHYDTSSPLDGLERFYSFRRVAGLPFVVLVGLSKNEVLGEWYSKAWAYLACAVILTLAMLGLLFFWLRSYQRAVTLAIKMSASSEENASRLRALLDSIPDLAWIRGQDHRFSAFNQAYVHMTGKPADSVMGKTVFEVWPSDLADVFHQADVQVLLEGETIHSKVELSDPQGVMRTFDYIRVPVQDDEGQTVGVAGIARDITDRLATEARIQHMVEHDALTDLPNRQLLQAHFSKLLARAEGRPQRLALLFLDLDHFKNINDTLGHEVGDKLLLQVADRLQLAVHADDFVCRQGGDEFVILLSKDDLSLDLDSIATTAHRLIEVVDRPLHLPEHELTLSASIGISVYPDDGQHIGDLLRSAEIAMYSAKDAGRNNFQFFTLDMNASLSERLSLEISLRKALQRNELQLHYQPQFEAKTGKMIGVEALLRWQHPELGLISPARFIPIAEETRLIIPIGEWVLREACRYQVLWARAGMPMTMAVNLSAVQFRQENLIPMIAGIIAETGMIAECLELEITEGVLVENTERSVQVLDQIKQLGVRLSIDDFGTGYSSLSYLKRFPLDKIKIDQSFVRELTTNASDAAIVQAIIALASKLGLTVIAEGTETRLQLDYLCLHDCQEVQGFYFSPAVPAERVPGFFAHDWQPDADLIACH